MAGSTPVTAIPYPTDTDLVTQGDEAMQAIAERIEARYPRGFLGRVMSTTTQAVGSGGAAITGLTITKTLYTDRLYRMEWSGQLQMAVAGMAILRLMVDGSPAKDWSEDLTVNAFMGFLVSMTFAPASTGTHTVSCYGIASAGASFSVSASSANPNTFTLEDVGPYPIP